jgi:hypothetical protein
MVETIIVIRASLNEKKKAERYFSEFRKEITQRRDNPLGGKVKNSPVVRPASTTTRIGNSR